ncbi:hypothetical protein HHI36_004307 [Cryptolaemus montrouzieri]|uniref:FYVE-type zinc finger domain-containing protein n=1 Tax=Cryptolaemus montrouzieri TaxID=559131 RepID=A0ABD2NQT5_9CUCU
MSNIIFFFRESKWHCTVCGEYFKSVRFVLGRVEFIVCDQCNRKVCKSTCSSTNLDGAWICQTCSERTDSWIDGAFRVVEPFTKALRARMSLIDEPPDEVEEDLETRKIKEKEQVRDFIERLVNNLIGENVDDASINKIYDDVNYETMFKKYHQDLSDILTDLGTSLHISFTCKLNRIR